MILLAASLNIRYIKFLSPLIFFPYFFTNHLPGHFKLYEIGEDRTHYSKDQEK